MTYRNICPFCKNNDSEGFRIRFSDCAKEFSKGFYGIGISLECMVCHESVNDFFNFGDNSALQKLAEEVGLLDNKNNLLKIIPKISGLGLVFHSEKVKV
jgi:hypothetical protein